MVRISIGDIANPIANNFSEKRLGDRAEYSNEYIESQLRTGTSVGRTYRKKLRKPYRYEGQSISNENSLIF